MPIVQPRHGAAVRIGIEQSPPLLGRHGIAVYPAKISTAVISGFLDITPSALAARCAPIICPRSACACRACVSTNPKVCVDAPPQFVVGIHSQLLRYIAAVRIGVVRHKGCHGWWPAPKPRGPLGLEGLREGRAARPRGCVGAKLTAQKFMYMRDAVMKGLRLSPHQRQRRSACNSQSASVRLRGFEPENTADKGEARACRLKDVHSHLRSVGLAAGAGANAACTPRQLLLICHQIRVALQIDAVAVAVAWQLRLCSAGSIFALPYWYWRQHV